MARMISGPDSRKVERIGDYRIVRVIGEGGMGIVYEAIERLSGRRVALKVLHSSLTRSQDARDRFYAEMRIMAGLAHPNIVRSLASTEVDGKLVLVLEYLEGRTLREEIAARGAMRASDAIGIAAAIASALAAAHEREPPIVHRDLKPENVMIVHDGTVRVMDFGIAKVLAEDAKVTRASQTVGTVLYMSPEQAESRPVTQQTDLYALGLVLHEMLTGKALFDGPSIVGILRDHCETPPPPLPEEIRRALPPGLEALMLELLEKSPDRRPQSARQVLGRLQAMQTGPAVAHAQPNLASFAHAPVPPALPAAAGPHGKHATIDLIARLDQKKPRWPWVAGALAVLVIGAAIAIPWTLYLQSSSSVKKTSSTSATSDEASAGAPASDPKSSADAGCGDALACAPFRPADPSRVDFDSMLTEATKLARSLEPTAQLWSISFLSMTAGPTIDLTVPKSVSHFHFEVPSGDLSISVSASRLVANRTGIRSRPQLPEITCTFQRAFESAIKGGFQQREIYQANLSTSPVSKKAIWLFSTDDSGSAQVDATTCELFRGPRKK